MIPVFLLNTTTSELDKDQKLLMRIVNLVIAIQKSPFEDKIQDLKFMKNKFEVMECIKYYKRLDDYSLHQALLKVD